MDDPDMEYAMTDAPGNLVRFRPMPGQRHDSSEGPPLTGGIAFGGLTADKVFESNALVTELNDRDTKDAASNASDTGSSSAQRRGNRPADDALPNTWNHFRPGLHKLPSSRTWIPG